MSQQDPVDRQAASTALQAAREAIARGAAVHCMPNPHYTAAESCKAMTAGNASLDPTRLVYFAVRPCAVEDRHTLCATLTFDRGLGDGSQDNLWFEARSLIVRTSADIAPGGIRIWQGLATSD